MLIKRMWTGFKQAIPIQVKHLLRVCKDDGIALCIFLKDYNKWKGYRNQKKIIYMLTPEHGNIGDAAIACGTHYFLQKKFPNILVLEFPDRMVRTHRFILKAIVGKKDLIILHGGGNLGDWYFAEELLRHRVVQNFKHNKIISLPQTISFNNRNSHNWLLTRAIKTYASHQNLTLICRDEKSFHFAQEHFKSCLLYQMPDMALNFENYYVNKRQSRANSVLFCLRNDIEKASSAEFIAQIKLQCAPLYKNFAFTDTTINSPIYMAQRKNIVEEKLDLFRKHSLIVTDRYHGAIFAYLTGTPCIAIPSADHKVEENCKYFKDTNLIKFVRDVDEFKLAIKALNEIKDHKRLCFSKEYFNNLKNMFT